MFHVMPIKKLRMFKSGFIFLVIILLVAFLSWNYLLLSENIYITGRPKEKTQTKKDDFNYGVVVDCGSSGSRLYVYYWKQHSGVEGDLLNITALKDKNNETIVMKKEPGLSSLGDHPSDATEYFTPLLQFVLKHIPSHKVKQTPLYVMATAGLRLLPKEKQEAILSNLRSNIPKHFDFILSDSHVEVISGKWEGLYAWIAINMALGKFTHKDAESSLTSVNVGGKVLMRKKTVGAMDLGGASMQATFELPPSPLHVDNQIKDSVVELDLGCTSGDSSHRYRLFTQTFLGFGGNEANKREHVALLKTFLKASSNSSLPPIPNTIPKEAPITIPSSSSSSSSSFQLPAIAHGNATVTGNSSNSSNNNNNYNSNKNKNNNNNSNNKKNNSNNNNNNSNNNGDGVVININNTNSTSKASKTQSTGTHMHKEQKGDFSKGGSHASRVKRGVMREPPSEGPLRSSLGGSPGGGLMIGDPCSPRGYSEEVKVDALSLGDVKLPANTSAVAYTLEGTGNMEECLGVVGGLLDKSRCPVTNARRCAMQGVVIPDINYRSIEFYGFSEFYYTMEDILGIAGKYNYQLFHSKAKEYCETSWRQVEEWRSSKKYPRADLQRYRTQCFKSAWLMTLLHDGLNLPKSFKHFTSINHLNGQEVHWSLGALLHKTRFYPLRDIEKTHETHRGGHKRLSHTSEFFIMVFLVCTLAAVLLYLCIRSTSISKLFSKKNRIPLQTNDDDFDPHIVLVRDNKPHDQKMVRSRSFNTFNSTSYAEV